MAPMGLVSILTVHLCLPSSTPAFHFFSELSASRLLCAGMGLGMGRLTLSCSTLSAEHGDLLEPGAPEGCGRAESVSVPLLFLRCPSDRMSPLLCVSPSLSMTCSVLLGNMSKHLEVLTALVNHLPGHSSGKCHFLWSPLTLGRNNRLLGICLCPGTRVVKMGPLCSAAVTVASFLISLPCIHPSLFFLFFPSWGGLLPLLVNSVCSKAS